MKILTRKQFLEMPANTLFSKYQPCCFGDIQIKEENCGTNDFFVQEISSAITSDSSSGFEQVLTDAEKNKSSVEMDFDCVGRDGLYDNDQLFAVWENKDIAKLIERLQKCKTE